MFKIDKKRAMREPFWRKRCNVLLPKLMERQKISTPSRFYATCLYFLNFFGVTTIKNVLQRLISKCNVLCRALSQTSDRKWPKINCEKLELSKYLLISDNFSDFLFENRKFGERKASKSPRCYDYVCSPLFKKLFELFVAEVVSE